MKGEKINKAVKASEIAGLLGETLVGDDIPVRGVGAITGLKDHTLSFIKDPVHREKLQTRALLLIDRDRRLDEKSKNSYIRTDNPRLAFARVVAHFFQPRENPGIAESARLGRHVQLGEGVSIGEYCVIGDGVSLGKGTVLNHHVVIARNCRIGEGCYIKSNTVIGEDGFGFELAENIPVRVPQLGAVVIGDHVEIGANCFIARGSLEDTIIEDRVKIDSQVHIAHNCRIGQNTIITAEAEISGSVTIGRNCWLAPNCTIHQKIRIGEGATVGMGAVVLKDVPEGQKIMGLEGVELWELLKYKKLTKYPFPS